MSLLKSLNRLLVVNFLVFMFAALLFTGCSTDGDGGGGGPGLNSMLIGTWLSEHGDSYTLTSDRIIYAFGNDINYAGTIRHVDNFTDSHGLIIIEYDSDHRPIYYADGYWGDADHILPLKGNFIGIYFQNFIPGDRVNMGGAFMAGGAEEPTLAAAIAAFIIGMESTYISAYGTYFLTTD